MWQKLYKCVLNLLVGILLVGIGFCIAHHSSSTNLKVGNFLLSPDGKILTIRGEPGAYKVNGGTIIIGEVKEVRMTSMPFYVQDDFDIKVTDMMKGGWKPYSVEKLDTKRYIILFKKDANTN